jgi:hypothetical protein
MRLPGEEELCGAIRAELATELQVTSDLLDLGTGIFRRGLLPKPEEEMEYLELWMCLGLMAKACQQYRAIVALAEISLGNVAESNGRMLLETLLTTQFLLRPVVTLRRGGKPLPEVADYPLTRAFRTKLYLAHDAASTLKTLKGMATTGDLSATDADRALVLAEKQVKEDADEIGPEWAERQNRSHTFTGVNIHDLAESLDQLFLYQVFYRPACAGVHGTNARKFVEPHEQPDGRITFSAVSNTTGVAEALVFSSLAFHEVLNVANERLGLGIDERLGALARRIREMAHRFPNE